MFGQITQLSGLIVTSFFKEATWVFMGRKVWGRYRKHFPSKRRSHLMALSIYVHKGTCLTEWCLLSHADTCSSLQASVSFYTSLYKTAFSRWYRNVYLQDNHGIYTVPNNMPESGVSNSDAALTWNPLAAAQMLSVLSGHTEETAGRYERTHAIEVLVRKSLSFAIKSGQKNSGTWSIKSHPHLLLLMA